MRASGPKSLLLLDIDGTMMPERTNPLYEEGEREYIRELNTELGKLQRRGKAVIAFVSNGMFHLYGHVKDSLIVPDYLSGNASTRIWPQEDGELSENMYDAAFERKILSSNFDRARAEREAGRFSPLLVSSGPEHQTHLKSSFTFARGVAKEQRKAIYEALKESAKKYPGTGVFYVEGGDHPNDPRAVIDYLPEICTKEGIARYLMEHENIPAGRVIVAGNGDNDISMFHNEFNGIAVGNAQPALKDHVQRNIKDGCNQVIAPYNRARGLLWGLKHFNII